MTIALLALVAAHVFDYISFLVMTARHGLAAELNPLVVTLAQEFGLPGLTFAKIASVAFLAGVVLVIAAQRRRMARIVLTVGITAGLVGGISNIASI